MRRLLNHFLRGLVVTAPIAITLYITWVLFRWIDSLLGLPIPGLGFVVTVGIITLVGLLASNLLTRGLVSIIDEALQRLPFVRLLYSSTKDLLNAFVGEQRRFDKPVLVTLVPEGGVRAIGFVTRETVEHLGLAAHVAVYLPQSYNFAGQVLLVPAAQVQPLALESAEALAFIVSGGVSGSPAPPPARPA